MAPALAYYDLAPWLAISSGPPTVVTAGDPFAIDVEVENSDGSLDANFAGSVTISVENDPGGAGLGGTLTETVQGGYAVFTGLTLTRAAEGYTILAVSGGGPAAATSASFAVVPAAPAQILVDPSSASHALSIAVLDGYGNIETSFAGSVTVQWGTGGGTSGPVHHAKISATANHGVVTFAHLKPGGTTGHRVIQASADGITASAVLARSNRDLLRLVQHVGHTGHVVAKPAAHRDKQRVSIRGIDHTTKGIELPGRDS